MSHINEGLFASGRSDWGTPQSLFDDLHAEFRFTLDVCAALWNRKLDRCFVPAVAGWSAGEWQRLYGAAVRVDGLAHSWAGERCFMNPPYGDVIKAWVSKARMEAERGTLVVGLLPVRTDTKWFHRHVYHAATEIRFLKGRLKFEGGKALSSAPFPSMIVVWGTT